ncbi:unnamed protein product [Fraxinus pennsylvanica]|uniref:Uncharacterized protein n=1 Tax=Fraxinus pennsylvanica TaxID=56036 RepID=A0AAD1Z4U4_9LAMI|nr:unnamed protein product [Fraxinus pennsylvanica]
MPDSVMGFVKEKMSLLGSARAKDLEEKWKDLFEKETELYLEMLSLMREQTKLALGMFFRNHTWSRISGMVMRCAGSATKIREINCRHSSEILTCSGMEH